MVGGRGRPASSRYDLQTSVACPYSITLPPGFSLTGNDKDRCVLSFSNGNGIGLTANNQVSGITIIATPGARAIYTQAAARDARRLALSLTRLHLQQLAQAALEICSIFLYDYYGHIGGSCAKFSFVMQKPISLRS